jgi:ABC-type transport system substrate-binding protein
MITDVNCINLSALSAGSTLLDDTPPDVLKLYLNDEWREFDPYYKFREYQIDSLTHDTLVKYNTTTREYDPQLATDWFVTGNAKQWTFFLREDVYFHNGELFTAQHVKFTFDRLINPENFAYLEPELTPRNLEFIKLIKSIKVISSNVITFHLFNSSASFISSFVRHWILTPSAFEDGNITEVIGTGPYILESNDIELTEWTYHRNTNYYKGIPPFKQITGYFFEDMGLYDMHEQFELGMVDTLGGGWLPEVYDYIRHYSDIYSRFRWANFNLENKILQDRLVRHALNLGMDRSYFEEDRTIFGYFVDGFRYLRDDRPMWHHNPDLANQILDDRGYLRNENGTRFSLTVMKRGGIEENDPMESIFDSIGVQLELLPSIPMSSAVNYSGYDIITSGFTAHGAFDPAQRMNQFKTGFFFNFGGYSNKTIDNYIQLAENTPVRQEREYYYNILVDLLYEQAPLLDMGAIRPSNYIREGYEQYFSLNYFNLFQFTYISTESDELNQLHLDGSLYNGITTSFEISNSSVYFRKQDFVIETLDQSELMITALIDDNNESIPAITMYENLVKYVDLKVDKNTTPYQLKLYYDTYNGIDDVFLWKWTDSKWVPVQIDDKNITLQYMRLINEGDTIFGLSFKNQLGAPIENTTPVSTTSVSTDSTDETINPADFKVFAYLIILVITAISFSMLVIKLSRQKEGRVRLLQRMRFYGLFLDSRPILKILFGYGIFLSGVTIIDVLVHEGGL